MITLSEFIKVVPQIKEGSFRYKILGEKNPFPENSIFSFEYVWFKDFANRFDFKRLQVVKCERRYIGYETEKSYSQTMRENAYKYDMDKRLLEAGKSTRIKKGETDKRKNKKVRLQEVLEKRNRGKKEH